MKPIGRAERAAVERLRKICLALPGATEKKAWGEPTWRAGKIFAQMDTHHHGADHLAVWLPARPGVQEALVAEDPERFFRIHRSAIVQLDRIETLLRGSGGDYAVRLKGGAELSVSRNRRESLEARLGLGR